LQPTSKLVNPYWGSEMLECGEVVRQIPAGRSNQPAGDDQVDPPLSNTRDGQ